VLLGINQRQEGQRREQRLCKKNKIVNMFTRVVRVRDHLAKKWSQGVLSQDKVKAPSWLEIILLYYQESKSMLVGTLLLAYLVISVAYSIPILVFPKLNALKEFVMSVAFIYLTIVWIFGKMLGKMEESMRYHDTGIVEVCEVFLFGHSEGMLVEKVVECVESDNTAYDEMVEREWIKLCDLVDKYDDHSIIYLGNDFYKAIAPKNVTRLNNLGYYYDKSYGNSSHTIKMTKPSSTCILF
jgi:hypothetical protein